MKTMTSKERLATAFRRGIPDRIPVGPMVNPGWLSLAGNLAEEFIRKVDLMMDIHLCSEPELFLGERIKDILEKRQDGNLISEVIHTPKGDLTRVMSHDPNRLDWVLKPFLETREDIEKFLSVEYRPIAPDLTVFKEWETRIGNEGWVMPLIADAICLPGLWMTPEKFIMTCIDDPGLIKELIEVASVRVNNYVEMLCLAGIRCFRIAGPELASQTLMGPSWFEKLVSPYDESLNRIIHLYNGVAFCHCHGRIKSIITQIADAGYDVLSPIEEPPAGDITVPEAKKLIGDRMCLVGNLDEIEFLGRKTRSEIVRRSIELMRAAGQGGGFVLGGTESGVYTDAMLKGFLVMAETAEQYGFYENGNLCSD